MGGGGGKKKQILFSVGEDTIQEYEGYGLFGFNTYRWVHKMS